MYDDAFRARAVGLCSQDHSLNSVSREFGVARATLRQWLGRRDAGISLDCVRCQGAFPISGRSYASLLGYYLGDGTISVFRSTKVTLRVSCDATYPGIIDDVSSLLAAMGPRGRVFHVRAPGAIVVQSMWKHWLCLFPQHGAGRKHDRTIELEDWQLQIVDAFPADFLRGLFHSDGSRVRNWATRRVWGELKRYDYPRWQFSNKSEDIHALCSHALDVLAIPWRRSSTTTISVSRREAVARLDELIGLKA